MMDIFPIRDLGPFGTNCYILADEDNSAILIDAPYSAEIIDKELKRRGLALKKILLTHGHCDHIEALNGLCTNYGCEVMIHPSDRDMLYDAGASEASYFGMPFEPFKFGVSEVTDGGVISLGRISLEVLHTPGHTPGSVCYISKEAVFTGDTLFEGSIGRTDLGNGDYDQLMHSINCLIKKCGKMRAFPGHGMPTDTETERLYNPYLRDLEDFS